jgi:two-component system phosphate regulon response regulator PhoB
MPDLILLDLMLPGIPGIPLCRQIRNHSATAKIPIIMLTAKSQESDVIAGLEAGAADYVTKPFSPRILVARIRAVLGNRVAGKNHSAKASILMFGDLTINPERFEVKVGTTPLFLTANEFGILFTLASKPGCVFSRDHIIEQVKGTGYSVSERTIDVQVASLRKKLSSAADRIETVRGVGYKFQDV